MMTTMNRYRQIIEQKILLETNTTTIVHPIILKKTGGEKIIISVRMREKKESSLETIVLNDRAETVM
jgi:hypothetical protein